MNEEMISRFLFDKGSPIILYGAATIGCMLDNHLTSLGYQIKGFMDLRAEEMEDLHGKTVFLPGDESLSRDYVIIVAVKNVFEHGRIASDLAERGFKRLIYRPYACLKGQGNEIENQLNDAYDSLTDFKGDSIPFEGQLPLSQFSIPSLLRMSGILDEKESMITAYIPVTMLFSDKVPQAPEFSVLFMRPHLQFVKYILGMEGGETEAFIQYCREGASKVGGFETTVSWENNVVRNQTEVYAQMNHMYNIERNFFLEQAPYVRWNEKKYFNLQSGKHRSTFLVAKGDNYVAVKMTKDDFDAWIQASTALETDIELGKQYKQGLSVPIENPFFYEYSCIEEQFWYQLVRIIMEKVSETEYRNSKVNILLQQRFVVALSDSGFIKRFLRRCGFEVAVWREVDQLEHKLDKLLGFDEEDKEDSVQDWEYVKYMIYEEGTDIVAHKHCKVENLFLITDKKDYSGNKIMMGLCRGRQVSIYLMKNVIL